MEGELNYIRNHLDDDGVLTSDQIIIQTPSDEEEENILTPDALLLHLEVLRAATQVTIDLFDS